MESGTLVDRTVAARSRWRGDPVSASAWSRTRSLLAVLAVLSAVAGSGRLEAAVPTPDHVVIVIEENHAFGEIYGSSSAPYINALASQGATFTKSFAVTHPSQPNYLAFFSGSTQGVTDDSTPHSFTTANLGAAAIAKGLSFRGYSEDLPSVGSLVGSNGAYQRKHNPWSNWQDAATNGVPAADNLPLTSFPSDYTQLPRVSFVIPNQNHDMHDGSIATGDAWLKAHLDGYVQWAKTHNSLLIVTWDEDDFTTTNRILTVFVGANVKAGAYAETINHYNVLRTIEDMYGLTHSGNAVSATPISDCWSGSAVAPAITSQPRSTTVTAGQTATFAVSASGSPAPTYQWRKNGAAIPGATAASYTTPATTTADNGAAFTVVATNSAGSATSSSATLTVTSGTIVSGAWYELTSKSSGKRLDVYQSSTANGANVDQWTGNGSTGQQWRIDDMGGGYYRLVAKCSGENLDVAGASTARGANVLQWPENGGANQRWRIVDMGGGWYKLVSKNSGMCLDVTGWGTADGTNVEQWTDNGGDNQRWSIDMIAPAGSG